ncbi:hypothetical protein [Microvirga sp. KLBC 81]|uniref:hypothetical protein n=1 Tax=Microvirga sp. KLBC 81 TaxID=1862707 RepID=UPI001057658C|nr:hypothetical protein [Microvirga sp. KLBC 81]
MREDLTLAKVVDNPPMFALGGALPTPAPSIIALPRSGNPGPGRGNRNRECRLIQPRTTIGVSFSSNLTVPVEELIRRERANPHGYSGYSVLER